MEGLNLTEKQIRTLCQDHNVEALYLFGSVLNDNFNDESDIDFLVKFLPIDLQHYFRNYLSLKENLENISGRAVDLVEEQSIKNPIFRKNIDRSKVKIYG